MSVPADDIIARLRGEWPFAARHEELAELLAIVDAGAADPARPAAAVVVAPAGVGKSRLLREASAAAAGRGLPTSQVLATRSASEIPFAAVAHLGPSLPASHPDPASWFQAVAMDLRPGEGTRHVLAVDDAHLLDPGSAALVLHVALTGAATVLVSIRRGEPTPDPIVALWKDGVATRIDLQPLSIRETELLVQEALGGEVAAETAQHVARVSQGNALYTRELVLAAVTSGDLREVDGTWRWNGEVVLAPRLVEAVGTRLAGLDEATRQSLAMLALGEPLRLEVAEAVAGRPCLAQLEDAGLLHLSGPPGATICRLVHPLHGEVVLATTGVVQRRRMLCDLAAALADFPETDDRDLVRIATWRLDAGDDPEPGLLTRAAQLANQSFDHALAQRLARAAHERDAGAAATVALATALHGQNRFREAELLLAEVEDDVLDHPDLQLREDWLVCRFATLYRGLGRHEDTDAVLERFAAAHLRPDATFAREGAHLVAGHRAGLLVDEGRLTDVVAVTDTILDDPAAGELPRLFALGARGEALAYLGRSSQATQVQGQLHELAATGSPRVQRAASYAVLQHVMVLLLEGRVADAVPRLEGIHDGMANTADPEARALLQLVIGSAQLLQGTPVRARRHLREAVTAFRDLDILGHEAWALAMLAHAEALRSDLTSSRRRMDQARALRPQRHVARSLVDLATGEVMLESVAGNVTAAAQLAVERAATLVPDLLVYRARLLHLACRLDGATRAVARDLADLADEVEGGLVALQADHAAALVARDGAALDVVAEGFAARGLWLWAAEAAAQASRAHHRDGERAAAHRSATDSRQLRERCEGAMTPTLLLASAVPDLSPREGEVVRLAAAGLSNAEIAHRLVVSVRTVESHLYRVFAKLGISHRDELAGIVGSGSAGTPATPPVADGPGRQVQ